MNWMEKNRNQYRELAMKLIKADNHLCDAHTYKRADMQWPEPGPMYNQMTQCRMCNETVDIEQRCINNDCVLGGISFLKKKLSKRVYLILDGRGECYPQVATVFEQCDSLAEAERNAPDYGDGNVIWFNDMMGSTVIAEGYVKKIGGNDERIEN